MIVYESGSWIFFSRIDRFLLNKASVFALLVCLNSCVTSAKENARQSIPILPKSIEQNRGSFFESLTLLFIGSDCSPRGELLGKVCKDGKLSNTVALYRQFTDDSHRRILRSKIISLDQAFDRPIFFFLEDTLVFIRVGDTYINPKIPFIQIFDRNGKLLNSLSFDTVLTVAGLSEKSITEFQEGKRSFYWSKPDAKIHNVGYSHILIFLELRSKDKAIESTEVFELVPGRKALNPLHRNK